MTATDRLNGATGEVAIKVPCRVATTANITLNGLQTIDGVTVVQDDRVLVIEQTDATENGIYLADSGIWQRARDFDGNGDAVRGTRVVVNEGTTYAGTSLQLNTVDPVVIGTSDIDFSVVGASSGGGETLPTITPFMETMLDDLTAAAARTTLGAVGLTGNESVAGNKTLTGDTTVNNVTAASGKAINLTAATTTVAAPASDAHAATKKYVDDEIAAIAPSGSPINQSSTGPTVQKLTSGSGATYSTPAGAKWIKVIMRGAGGSGGGNSAGNAGGASIFNSIQAAGGSGGGALNTGGTGAAGGAGGTGGSGTASYRFPGARGGSGSVNNGTDGVGGSGGGAGGAGGTTGAGTSAAANSSGGGGGYGNTDTNGGGGGGGEGETAVLIINNPNASYTYTIGAGGTQTNAGSGGSGVIVVEEHYNY